MKPYPANPRYLEFRSRPIASVGSGEHYGAVLNADFDFVPYLDEMARDGLNQCRVFSGTYREIPGEFGIAQNNLAPRAAAYLCPWRRSGEQWDLHRWDDAYWERLSRFCRLAGERGILAEYVLFCFWYNDALWAASPMHPKNNIQGIGPTDRSQVYAPSGDLLHAQQDFVRKAVETLRGFDNVYFEICNEPYSRNDHTMDDAWHRVIADTIRLTDGRCLIAVNYQNRTLRIHDPHPAVAIANFHYALPEAAHSNYHLGLILADDETGFAGQSADPYRQEAWQFFLAGGAMFSHLDYSFTVAHPDGTGSVQGTKTPGYGGKDLRRQLGFLRKTIEKAEIWRMRPMNEAYTGGAGAARVQTMGLPGVRYLAHFAGMAPGARPVFGLPAGAWRVRWLDPVACTEVSTETIAAHPGGYFPAPAPAGLAEAVLHLEAA